MALDTFVVDRKNSCLIVYLCDILIRPDALGVQSVLL